MDLLNTFLSPMVGAKGPIQDTMKLVIIGGTVETARRASMSAWNSFIGSFMLVAHFTQDDYPYGTYDWIMYWLSKQPSWGRSREFDITTKSSGRRGMNSSSTGDLEDSEEEIDDETQLVHGKKKRTVAFLPTLDSSHGIFYRGHWLRITRCKRTTEWGSVQELKISVVARNNTIIKQLVLEAKKLYEKDAEHRVHIFMADEYGGWRWNGARQKRPLSSIVLEEGVKQMLIADCKDFMRSEDWYAERGIPFRRGYLLHGVPGSGKTSLIHAIAGELGLDIYCLSLSSKGMSDTMLAGLMARVPSRCIVLLEDLDAAFTKSTNRDATSTGLPAPTTAPETTTTDGSTLSLSGLLNSIDGISATEGRLLFATTNYLERLDSALSRPGRMDVWVNFTNASRWQAEGIFKCFFPCKKPEGQEETADDNSSSEEGHDALSNTPLPPQPVTERNLPKTRRPTIDVPLLEAEEIAELAKAFAAAIPEDEMSVASLQGYLLKNKTRPREAVAEVGAWITKERELKAKLKKEKEDAEKKEKEEKAAAEAKEKAEKLEAEEKAAAEAKAAAMAAAAAAAAETKTRRRARRAVVPLPPPSMLLFPQPHQPPFISQMPLPAPPALLSSSLPNPSTLPQPNPSPQTISTDITDESGSEITSSGSGSSSALDDTGSEEDDTASPPPTTEKWVAVKPAAVETVLPPTPAQTPPAVVTPAASA